MTALQFAPLPDLRPKHAFALVHRIGPDRSPGLIRNRIFSRENVVNLDAVPQEALPPRLAAGRDCPP
jgi:hypothetical protein